MLKFTELFITSHSVCKPVCMDRCLNLYTCGRGSEWNPWIHWLRGASQYFGHVIYILYTDISEHLPANFICCFFWVTGLGKKVKLCTWCSQVESTMFWQQRHISLVHFCGWLLQKKKISFQFYILRKIQISHARMWSMFSNGSVISSRVTKFQPIESLQFK